MNKSQFNTCPLKCLGYFCDQNTSLRRLEAKGGNKPLGGAGLEQDEWLNIGNRGIKEGPVCFPVTPVCFQAQTKDRSVGLGYPD